jgi:Deoxynucleoside kinase
VVVMERSLRVAREVFMTGSSHLVNASDLYLLMELSRWGEREYEAATPAIYLTCSNDAMLERVKRRNRRSEQFIEYALLLITTDGKYIYVWFFRASRLTDVKEKMDRWAKSKDLYTIDATFLDGDGVAYKIMEWHKKMYKN